MGVNDADREIAEAVVVLKMTAAKYGNMTDKEITEAVMNLLLTGGITRASIEMLVDLRDAARAFRTLEKHGAAMKAGMN